MRIWDSIRGHFALMEGKTLHTLAQHKPFTIQRVIPKNGEADWVIVLSVGDEDRPQYVYITDMLKVYFLIIRNGGGWRPRKQIEEDVDISKFQTSYLMAMMTTFDDIEANKEGNAIRYVE